MWPVDPWPGPPPLVRDGVIVIGIATEDGSFRAGARQGVRRAVQEVLAHMTGLAPDKIDLRSAPGQAPCIVLSMDGVHHHVGWSISHESGRSLAAMNLHGAVGIDLMQVQEVPDWERVARDYLGAEVACTLADLAPERRAHAFAKAWTRREAGLKCQGLALAEWRSDAPPVGRSFELALPEGLVGTLVIAPTSPPDPRRDVTGRDLG